MQPRRILCSIGTRPEAIKMAPVVRALDAAPWAETRVVATAQHRELLDDVLRVYGIEPYLDLNVMRPGQDLPDLTAKLLPAFDRVLRHETPALVLAQGDTTSVLVAALACFYRRVAFGHVEAGLRTGDPAFPFPEEINRTLVAKLAAIHFAPTPRAAENLMREGIDPATIHTTGNTIVDALRFMLERDPDPGIEATDGRRLILMTAHRREHFGAPMEEIFAGARDLVDAVPDVELIYPIHPNPNVAEAARRALGDHPRIRLIAPMDHLRFIGLMRRATLVLTDSGGVQEEAPALGVPSLVLRDRTERPEAIEAGLAVLVGPHRERIAAEGIRLLTDPERYKAMARAESPYGDGRAGERIAAAIDAFFRGARACEGSY
jgi:UDP-N-acetylglucosamine 2-epimerase (non-hydrolysing)